ncbi:flagellin [Solidesulfovibrio magneticus RS-1]|uniref:Flagellin n=1 Tax=Solidesulfovibrio magneticus (strain ATCC 700980 / DSM 13731 / RS-1) TaxID=573370 RepID=C4XKX9_SOLM1|nr:flagellin [Solidesulfovibrio magneticus RS-1]
MALVINHNLMAMNSARNLSDHYGALSTSTQRLSSGLRINSAADDAAGLAVRELMRSDVATLNQGVRNANDAISLIQTADGALQIIDEKLIRMKELAEQAATGTYSSDQRIIIDSEFQAMMSEIQRIAISTDFNSIKLLDGSSNPIIELGEQINQSGFGISPLTNSASYGIVEAGGTLYCSDSTNSIYKYDGNKSWTAVSSGLPAGIKLISKYDDNLVCGILTGSGVGVYQYQNSTWTQINTNGFGNPNNFGMDSMIEKDGDLYVSTNNPTDGVNIYKYNSGTSWTKINTDGFGDLNNTNANLGTSNGKLYASTWNNNGTIVYEYESGTSWKPISQQGFGNGTSALQFTNLDGELYGGASSNDGAVIYKYTEGGNWEQINSNGFGDGVTGASRIVNFQNELYVGTGGLSPGDIGGVYKYTGNKQWEKINDNGIGNTNNRSITLYSAGKNLYATSYNPTDGVEVFNYLEAEDNKLTVQFGTQNRKDIDSYDIPATNSTINTNGLNIQDLNIRTQNGAQYSLERIDNAIVKKDKIRANLGATQNRLENTVSNIQIQAENLQAAESQISDTDVAEEMTNFVKEQILSQAAVAMLSQANSLPKMALQLIEG